MSHMPRLLVEVACTDDTTETEVLDLTPVMVRFSRVRIEHMIAHYATLADGGKPDAHGLRVMEMNSVLNERQRKAGYAGKLRIVTQKFGEKIAQWFEAIGQDPRAAQIHLEALEHLDWRIQRAKKDAKNLAKASIEDISAEDGCLYSQETDRFYDDPDSLVDAAGFRQIERAKFLTEGKIREYLEKACPVAAFKTTPYVWSGFNPTEIFDLFRIEDELDNSLDDHFEDADDYIVDQQGLEDFVRDWLVKLGLDLDVVEGGEMTDAREMELLADDELQSFIKAWNAKQTIVSYYPDLSRMTILNLPAGMNAERGRQALVAAKRKNIASLEEERLIKAASWKLPELAPAC